MDTTTFEQRLLLAVMPAIVTAVLAGLLVPLILKLIETRKAEAMKRFEAALARQTKILESQANLLDDLTKALWAWRYQLMRVTYAGAEQSAEALESAWGAYDKSMWESLHSVRVQTTRARRLVSKPAYIKLIAQYDRIIEVDRRLGAAMKLKADVRKRELEEMNHEMLTDISSAIDDSLHMVAEEVRLVSPEAARKG
jgi:hypothetical protein